MLSRPRWPRSTPATRTKATHAADQEGSPLPEPPHQILFARFPLREGSSTTGSAWAEAPDMASRVLLARAGFYNEGLGPIFTAEDAGFGDVNQRIRLAVQLLTDAGYTTRVVPPLPRRHTEIAFRGRDLSYMQSRLVAATAQVHRAETVEDLSSAVVAVMDPETGLLERLTAFLDTASQRLDTIAEADLLPARPPMATALHDASAQLTTAGYLIAQAELAQPDEPDEPTDQPAAPRAIAARTRTSPPGSPTTSTTSTAPTPAAASARGAAR
ncbi:hypothetical protein ACIPLC_15840 [Kitasatospora sp. NPDC086801]|uniref:hypothetical protein n=1 Tax=unclassified Kitasatospora TaxID=2633591 RepID=UPI0038101B32